MHILVINDDGPPSSTASPYVTSLVDTLRAKTKHTVSVILPHTQRSWIGKAHMVGEDLTPTYFDVATSTVSDHPSTNPSTDEYVLIDGTPASCAQLGLHHFFTDRGPVDLVLSGPNYGRNTTAVFALSSGTLGGALEAAVCGVKAIALSYAFFDKVHDYEIIREASELSVKIVEKLMQDWGENVDVYSVNVPLVKGVETNKVMWTQMLHNKWKHGSCFREASSVDEEVGQPAVSEKIIREGRVKKGGSSGTGRKKFLWAPSFADVFRSVEAAGPGSDGWAVKEGCTSITPIRANFMHASGFEGEFQLQSPVIEPSCRNPKIHILLDYKDDYVEPIIRRALSQALPSGSWTAVAEISTLLDPKLPLLQFRQYEELDFDHIMHHSKTSLANAYVFRKALIRKNYLTRLLQHWFAKHPDSLLKSHVKTGEAFELDYAEFLEDALVECWDLKESMAKNAGLQASEREWWILKPGMSEKGQGVKLFSTEGDLQSIFEDWEEQASDSEDDLNDVPTVGTDSLTLDDEKDYVVTSHLRHFIAQPYIHPPLTFNSRKFHIRTYVVCVGALRVYVAKEMLGLFASDPYSPPWDHPVSTSFLTNTCLQQGVDGPVPDSANRFWDLPQSLLHGFGRHWKENVFQRICDITGELFIAAARGNAMDFQPLPNAFEIFGVDFLVDAQFTPWLLEVNAFPDFGQTGPALKEAVISPLMKAVVETAILPFFGLDNSTASTKEDTLVKVADVDLGKA